MLCKYAVTFDDDLSKLYLIECFGWSDLDAVCEATQLLLMRKKHPKVFNLLFVEKIKEYPDNI